MANKKIKNASPTECNGIKFKSQLEATTYKVLLQEGFSPEYETHKYLVWDGFVPTILFLTKNNLKRKDKRCIPIGKNTMSVQKPLTGITYTPDFYFEYNGKKIIIEVKGFYNDVFPYKFKMFRKLLEEESDADKYEIWEINSKKQLLECINHLKTLP